MGEGLEAIAGGLSVFFSIVLRIVHDRVPFPRFCTTGRMQLLAVLVNSRAIIKATVGHPLYRCV